MSRTKPDVRDICGTCPPCPAPKRGPSGPELAVGRVKKKEAQRDQRDISETCPAFAPRAKGDMRDTPLKGCPLVPVPLSVTDSFSPTPPLVEGTAVRPLQTNIRLPPTPPTFEGTLLQRELSPRQGRGATARYDAAALWPGILHDIANGAALSTALQRLSPAPSYWWAKDWLRRDPDLKTRYIQAVEDRADRLAEELIQLADTPMPAGLDGPSSSAWVQLLRVRIDVRKWAASKLKPKAYGERLDVSLTETRISISAALGEAQRRLQNNATIDVPTLKDHAP
jgi:hypothetical protein